MRVFHNIFKYFSSNHQDRHSDRVNSHQHRGKVDKTHRAKIIEFDKLDNDSQIDNDFDLYITYFLRHGHWKANDRSYQAERVWFYNSEPPIDIQEYNEFTDNTTDMSIFTTIPDNNHMLELSSPITVTTECKDGHYFTNFFEDKSDAIYRVDGFFIMTRNFFTPLSGNPKPDQRWGVSKETFTKGKFDSYVKPVLPKIDFYKRRGMTNLQNAGTAYFGDTDGRVDAVLYALLVSEHIDIRGKG